MSNLDDKGPYSTGAALAGRDACSLEAFKGGLDGERQACFLCKFIFYGLESNQFILTGPAAPESSHPALYRRSYPGD